MRSRKGRVANPECLSRDWEAGTSALRSSWCTKMCLNNGSVKFCMGCPSTARDCVKTLNEEPITPCLWKKKKLSDNLRSGPIWAVLIHYGYRWNENRAWSQVNSQKTLVSLGCNFEPWVEWSADSPYTGFRALTSLQNSIKTGQKFLENNA